MHREFAISLVKIYSNPKLKQALDSVLIGSSNNSKTLEAIQVYYDSIRLELEDLANCYLKIPGDIDEEEIVADQTFFKEQLTYLWIHLESDWIRYNNIANYKLTIEFEEDYLIQSKATICSFFMQPIGLLLDKEILRKNLEFIFKLLERSDLSTDRI